MLTGMVLAGALGDKLGVVTLLNGQGGMYVLAGLLALVLLWDVKIAPRAISVAAAQEEMPITPST